MKSWTKGLPSRGSRQVSRRARPSAAPVVGGLVGGVVGAPASSRVFTQGAVGESAQDVANATMEESGRMTSGSSKRRPRARRPLWAWAARKGGTTATLAAGPGAPDPPYGIGRWLALAAVVLALAYAAISAYWGLGGTWLLATVGASLVTTHVGLAVTLAVWAAVVMKATGAVILLATCRPPPRSRWQGRLRVLSWAEAVGLAFYGFVFTAVDVAAQAGVVHPGKTADRLALAWHAYLWDPWFFAWGLLALAALLLTRPTEQRAEKP
jgi:hypothetical protein